MAASAASTDGGLADRLQLGVGGDPARDGERHQAEDALEAPGGVLDVVRADAHQHAAVRAAAPRRPRRSATAARMLSTSDALEAPAVAALEEELAVAAEDDAPVLRGHGRASSTRARGAWRGERPRRRPRPRAAASREGGRPRRRRRPAVVSRESEKRSTPVRSSTPIAFKVGLGPAVLRGAGRAGRDEHAARLERVQQRLGRQPGERQRDDVRRARRAGHRRARARRRPPARPPPADRAAPPRASRRRRRAPAAPARPRARTRRSAGRFSVPPRRPALLAAADPERLEARARPQPERAGAARPVQLVRGERERVGAERARAQAQQAERLHRVDVQVRAPRRRAGVRAARAISAIGCTVPSSFCTSITATTAVSGADGRGDRLGARRHRRARAATTSSAYARGRPAPRRRASPPGARAR